MVQVEFLFREGRGYDDLVGLIESNPRYVFSVHRKDKTDKRTRRAKARGWTEVRHRQYQGSVRVKKDRGCCWAEVTDESPGRQLTGAWINWLANNAGEIVYGVDVRFEGRRP